VGQGGGVAAPAVEVAQEVGQRRAYVDGIPIQPDTLRRPKLAAARDTMKKLDLVLLGIGLHPLSETV
jgi:hypothetical protein